MAGVVCEIQVRVKDVLLVCGMRQLVCAMRHFLDMPAAGESLSYNL